MTKVDQNCGFILNHLTIILNVLFYDYIKWRKAENPYILEAGACKSGLKLMIIFIINKSINFYHFIDEFFY